MKTKHALLLVVLIIPAGLSSVLAEETTGSNSPLFRQMLRVAALQEQLDPAQAIQPETIESDLVPDPRSTQTQPVSTRSDDAK